MWSVMNEYRNLTGNAKVNDGTEIRFDAFGNYWGFEAGEDEFMFSSPPNNVAPPKWVIVYVSDFWYRHEPWCLFYRHWDGMAWETIQFGTHASPLAAMLAARRADLEEGKRRAMEELDQWCRDEEEKRSRT